MRSIRSNNRTACKPSYKDWDFELIDMLGYPRKIFQKLIMPGTSMVSLTEKVKEEVGFDLEVVAPATHDTGSAVLAVPANDHDFIYISSGTWSLMGLERETADCSKKELRAEPYKRRWLYYGTFPLPEKHYGSLDDPVCTS